MRGFDLFVAADWSGAKNTRDGSIAVAVCEPGEKGPRLLRNAGGAPWSRQAVMDWLSHEIGCGKNLIAGFDFAFSLPYDDRGAYFPGHRRSPISMRALWRLVDEICDGDPDLYAGSLMDGSGFADFLHRPGRRGRRYQPRLRVADRRCMERSGLRPASVFKCVGPGQVGPGSFAGMRFLHRMKKSFGDAIAIWPSQSSRLSRALFVEIYPRLFLGRAGWRRGRPFEDAGLRSTLARFGTRSAGPRDDDHSAHDIDALVSAAALRRLAADDAAWRPNGVARATLRREGWIFGV